MQVFSHASDNEFLEFVGASGPPGPNHIILQRRPWLGKNNKSPGLYSSPDSQKNIAFL